MSTDARGGAEAGATVLEYSIMLALTLVAAIVLVLTALGPIGSHQGAGDGCDTAVTECATAVAP